MHLKINTDNAAFGEDDGTETDDAKRAECARILREVAENMENGSDFGPCMDVNGNCVGKWSL